MGLVAGVLYGALGVALVAAGLALRRRESMDDIPLYDPEAADDPVALARLLGLALAVFGLLTLAFGVAETFDRTTGVVVVSYALVVLLVALVTAVRSRQYE
ncbi:MULTISPECIES: hypothetical protein [Halobacterium]|uniref:hypothetical protein n=1 Tax=Halobacterium TaxID=2239 RepID=UPI00073ED29A|nr:MULTISPECIES: hypothetical protein [Halobacterium]MCG1002677.1 hypothetical protein [Halobacterium noricense]